MMKTRSTAIEERLDLHLTDCSDDDPANLVPRNLRHDVIHRTEPLWIVFVADITIKENETTIDAWRLEIMEKW
ncbi:hypothetical protein L195_g041791, partial [Trifolium pratense]